MKKATRKGRKPIVKSDPHSWKIVYDRFKPAKEGLREALCTLGNGYFGTRGAMAETSASRIHYPGTYLAGGYNKLATSIAGRVAMNEDFVNCPNWLLLMFKIGSGEWIIPSENKILSYKQELDMRRGLLTVKIRIQDQMRRRTMITMQRIVHMAEPHRAAIKYTIMPEDYEGNITIRSALDGTVKNTGVARYRQLNSRHLKLCSIGSFSKNGIYLSVKTTRSKLVIGQAARVRIFVGGKEKRPPSEIVVKKKKMICQDFGVFVGRRQCCVVEKVVSMYTSKDKGVRNPIKAAVHSAERSVRFDVLLKSHKKEWSRLWDKFDIKIQGDDFLQKTIRLHIFHLLQTASIHNVSIDAGLPARGLHGEAYRGHIFWDELFVLPVFDTHIPSISKALLMYRYNRLQPARKYARDNKYDGAMFPWQSGSTGEEETQTIHLNPMSGKWGPDHSCRQRHVSFAIAHNVWQYWETTADKDFLNKYGAEMLLSIAQFGASLSKYDPKDGRYHTTGLMGPDEFHERLPGAQKPGFKDNAYTNILLAWTLVKALEVLDILPPQHKTRLFRKLGLTNKAIEKWEDISRRMNVSINKDGVIEQFNGCFGLKELDWDGYRAKYKNIMRMDRILKAEGKSPNEYKVAKQADVLMLFYVLSVSEVRELLNRMGYKFHKNTLKKNYNYYARRTSHGSTLSKVVHCYVAHLIGRKAEVWKWFLEVLKSDVYDTQGGTTLEGIHAGVMAGSVDVAIRGFAGISFSGDKIKIQPDIPQALECVKLKLQYRNIWFQVCITRDRVTVYIKGAGSRKRKVPMEICGKFHRFSIGRTYSVPVAGLNRSSRGRSLK